MYHLWIWYLFDLKIHIVLNKRSTPFIFVYHEPHIFSCLMCLSTYIFILDSLRTTLCVRFKSAVVACGVVYAAARRFHVPLPENPPWWKAFDADKTGIDEVCRVLAHLYTLPKAQYIPVCKEGGSFTMSNRSWDSPSQPIPKVHISFSLSCSLFVWFSVIMGKTGGLGNESRTEQAAFWNRPRRAANILCHFFQFYIELIYWICLFDKILIKCTDWRGLRGCKQLNTLWITFSLFYLLQSF